MIAAEEGVGFFALCFLFVLFNLVERFREPSGKLPVVSSFALIGLLTSYPF